MNSNLPSSTGKTHAVVHDTWDKADLKRAYREVQGLRRARRKLAAQHWTGSEAVDDAFFVLHKADPHPVRHTEMRASHIVNHQVLVELLMSPAARRLREHTVGDLLAAATATAEIARNLEAIFDRLALAREHAESLQSSLEHVAALEADDDVETAGMWLSVAENQFDVVARHLGAAEAETADALNEALRSATEAAAEHSQLCHAWGVGPGELSRLPADDRLRLAKALNTPRMAEIAGLFGRISNLAFSTSVEEVDDLHDDVVDLESGSDLSRVVASEFLALAEPLTTPGFLARLASDDLLQVAIQGSDVVGRGAIIMCIDGSGSMAYGDRDLWAKAVMLVLLHHARAQGRQMHVIHFGYRQLLHRAFTRPTDFSAERIVEAAETFWASGTDFEAPMAKAVELLRCEYAESGRTQADVVFATDDECLVDDGFMGDYVTAMRELGARTWGLMVEGTPSPTGALTTMSEGRVLTVSDLTSGVDVRSLFAQIR